MKFTFDSCKTIEAVGCVLHAHGGSMGIMRLLKVLYIADRELLTTTGKTLTGDRAVAMKNGPILSKTYDYIKREATGAAAWEAYISKSGYQIHRLADPGIGRLSKVEVAKLHEICERYHDMDDWELSELTHEFPEWSSAFDPLKPSTAVPMKWEEVFTSQNRTAMIPEITRDLNAAQAFDDLLSSEWLVL